MTGEERKGNIGEVGNRIRYIDFHADTITELKENETLIRNLKMVSLRGLREAGCAFQCFSAFVPTGFFSEETRDAQAWREYQRILTKYRNTQKLCVDDLCEIRSRKDIDSCMSQDKIGTLFTIEDGGVLGGKMENLEQVYEDGVRLITLTWNHANAIGYPNSTDSQIMEKGLTEFGIYVVQEMQRKGMIVDVSHLSDGGFWDVYRNTDRPFVASHSNARALTGHPRNLTDEMIRAIAERGGVIGLNLYGPFLSVDGVSRVADMVRHVQHIYQTGGENVLALGSDFDGIRGELEIACPAELGKLYEALQKSGMSETVLEKMWMRNGLRVMRDTLPFE